MLGASLSWLEMLRFITIVLVFKEYVVLALLVILSLLILGANDNTQIRAIRSYTVGAVGILQSALSVIPNVVQLKRENEVLHQLTVNLSDEVNRLREARLENLRLRAMLGLKEHATFTLAAAEVVGKSLHLLRNTITVNVGENDGVKPDMPIISESGLVGKIIVTSRQYSIGQLMLNKDFRASAKIQRSRVDGIIAWDGGDYLRLQNVSKTQDVKEGDVVTTSEYSGTFPRDIKIGFVSKTSEKPGNLFLDIDVIPSVDFPSLEQVFIITAVKDTERVAIEKKFIRTK
ncbi:MAG: rod shape-determining protein MreC [Ignavibacteria bacterium]|nr:rod shape-determining protein MreC [Ignavibacteria bacterium]MBI3766195.1 rod shape-determining protein MreC [Ignavibacteriales bacterium]